MKSCAIVGAGEFYGTRFRSENYGLIIAADGGVTALDKIGIRPDLLIGDFDSLGNLPEDVEIIRHPVKKDETDMHLAYLEGVRRGYDTFYLFGGVGGREDHTFANYCLLLYAKRANKSAFLMGSSGYSFVIENEEITLDGKAGSGISVFAFGGAAEGVSIKGLAYEADRITLAPDFPLGVSNSFTGCSATVKVERGALLIIREYE